MGPEIHNCTNDISRSVDGTKHDCLHKTLGCLSLILLNLVFSTQAAYAAPIIMIQKTNERDRAQAQADYQTNIDAKLK
jgi:hypothetical protein